MKKYLIPCLIFLAAGVYYYMQACPTFYFWDSAELTTAVLGGGVPHPPGFPFFLILAKLWSWIVPLERAYALNLFSAFFAALGLALWYLAVRRFLNLMGQATNEIAISFVSAIAIIIIGISLTYSIQATRFEVYSLNFFGFAAIVLTALAIYNQKNSSRFNIVLFILFGLFLGVHNLTIALTVPGILALLIIEKKIKISQAALGVFGSIAIAILLYAIIFIRAIGHPVLNWGDPSNIDRLMDYILVRGFSVSATRLTATHFAALFGFIGEIFSRQLGIIGLLLSLIGIIYISIRRPRIGLPLVSILILNCLSVALAENYFYENYDLHGYLTISLAILAVFMAGGLLFIYHYLLKKLVANKMKSPMIISVIIIAILVTLGMGPTIKDNLFSADLSKVKTAADYSDIFLKAAPEHAIVITSSYNTYFCALASKSVSPSTRKQTILNLYDWDHQWGREEANGILGCNLKTDLGRQEFYRNVLNKIIKEHPIYIEYDDASAPMAKYLRLCGPGYLISISDSTSVTDAIGQVDIRSEISAFGPLPDIESIRTAVLWLQCRGKYYEQRGDSVSARQYYDAVESVVAKAETR
jgi:hypothetical protein